MDTRLLKATNDEGGTLTAQLASTETTTAHITPVPDKAPGLITSEPGTSNEEAIYYKSRDSGAGTISGLTRDYTNINGGVGKLHDNGSDWETLQAIEYGNNIVDALTEGFYLEHQTCTKITTASFTVEGNQTAFYTAGRQIRINGSINAVVASSSYSSPNTTVVVNDTPISAAITSVELAIQPKGASDIVAVRKATAAEILTGTDDTKIATPKGIKDAGIVPAEVVSDGWKSAAETWTYASASTITVPSGAASKYAVGDRIKWTQTTVKYGVIVAVADTLLTIAVNTDYTVTTPTAITDNYYSHELNPLGYPTYFAWTPTLKGSISDPTMDTAATGYFKIDGKNFSGWARTGRVSANGSGLYYFPVPTGITLNTTIFPAPTIQDAIDGNFWIPYQIGEGTIVNNNVGAFAEVGKYVVIVYTSTSFAIASYAGASADRANGVGSADNLSGVAGSITFNFSVAIT